MNRERLEALLRARWQEQTRLIAEAGTIMSRCIHWPEKQDESFEGIMDDMHTWLKQMAQHVHNLDSDIKELP